MPGARPGRRVRFGVFEADLRGEELRRHGEVLPLQQVPFQLLAALLARPGEIVTREELYQAIWPGSSFGVFDDNLNTAVRKLRQALGDPARNPRFIETLPRRGYRFIAPVARRGRFSCRGAARR